MDRATFEKLAIEHFDACYRLALQLTKHPDEASDLVQETYLRALRSAGTFAEERGGGMRSWLFTILHNAFYSRVERKAKGPGLSENLDESAASDEASPGEASPAWDLRSLDWEQVDERVKKAIEALSPEHREVLLLWGVEGMKYREIAAIVGVPIGTIMSRLHRARAILGESLEEMASERGWTG
jgi:RNA polymerase sigma-70 factor, ECF subfamily